MVGQFRDEDDPDRFGWIRAFPDMAARRDALTAFYVNGAAWRKHREAANACMVDSDDVLLLRPARPHSGFTQPAAQRPPVGASAVPDSRIAVTICHRHTPVDEEFLNFIEQTVAPALAAAGAPPLA
ncbi:hypothetical protein [Goodfellowiella coeruleoviolacea]|uniref:NIPSNAP protein n=1 Tax=Goodfellowiella coeruleoviolacea TaxID=334858 RepID=A0AAE3KFQ0_9PSEU|nr:hypothetical protein [Goodfellowiella coeruleoviolacea]MCP2164644.1 NIPSNAP protein [Goodfellowiella coeruleoviolacea]